MKTILGTGQLGLAILEALLQQNSEEAITLVNRKGELKATVTLPPNVQIKAADVTNKSDMADIASQSEVIFSCTDVPYQLWADFYPATASALAYALSKTEARLVFADNLYSYGDVKGKEIIETMPHKAKTKKGQIRTGVVNTLLNSGEQLSKRVAIVKAADFIGPRIYKGLFGTDFLDRLYQGKSIILSGNPKLPHTFTYIHDFAKAIARVGDAQDAFGQIWHTPNAPAMNLYQWIELFEIETHKKAKAIVLPKLAVWMAGFFNPLIKEYYELAYQFEHPYLVNHDKFVKRFGNHATQASIIVQKTVEWHVNKLEKHLL
ncbi:NAD-dependent epimerase/dehydratase family protein [Emticicia sp. BO119]|uniref:NAD-dependent epimerase/dehydratase family protein n=1 Tax=Emticicia sp. BO119 TaxID=2757768 RepID=UPI0015F0524A|nr:NAD-dependent epimerase/dehydratase family protein [Emticicia sp. BO119]MBA4853794.1 NAD-dependent epimerase/dehydratase family protein [Emticicia sp. BO119]